MTARIEVTVSPGAARSVFVGRHGDGWKVRVAAQPERGRANDALVALLAERLHVGRADIKVVAGHSSRRKTVEITGLAQQDVERRLAS